MCKGDRLNLITQPTQGTPVKPPNTAFALPPYNPPVP